jgi:hypothetical protein
MTLSRCCGGQVVPNNHYARRAVIKGTFAMSAGPADLGLAQHAGIRPEYFSLSRPRAELCAHVARQGRAPSAQSDLDHATCIVATAISAGRG